MIRTGWRSIGLLWMLAAFTAPALAQDYLSNKTEVEELLSGNTFIGIYLRTESAFTLNFAADGKLTDAAGANGRWWVDDEGRYCREWLDGRLKGNSGCMHLELEDGQLAMYSNGKKVVEGVFVKP